MSECERDGRCPGKDPDGGRCLPAGLDGGRKQMANRGHLSWAPAAVLPHRLGRNRAEELRVLCYQQGGKSEADWKRQGPRPIGRCTGLEK